GDGVAYRIEYGVRASISHPLLWIEESGCWFAGPDGKPARVQGIVRLDNERHAREEQLLKLSRHDPLTGELNRTHLVAALAEAIEEAMRFRASFAFMLIGIDHLARINDAFGFDVADQVISDVAKRIRARLRGGSFLTWRPNVERDAQRRVNIRVTDEIVTALNERRIVMAFEPVVDARTREPAFHECLVRMQQDEGQFLLAPDIVPVAEKLGLIRLVDHRVLELVVAELAM